jgi:MSHA pilin protein MshD
MSEILMRARQRPISPRRSRARRGFTLIESLISVLIVSGVLLAALRTFGAIARVRLIETDRTLAYGLADQMLKEVMQCYFKEIHGGGSTLGPDPGETRATYDDVDDYDGLSDSPPQLKDGTVLTEFTGWTRSVSVTCVRPESPAVAANAGDPQVLKRIVVTVKSPRGVTISLVGLRSSDGPYEQAPTTTTNYLTWGGVSARVGDLGKTVYGGARPLNVQQSQ